MSSQATAPGPRAAAFAVLGDMLELGNRSAAEHYRIGRIAATKADVLYTYGTNSVRMVSGAITGGMKQKFVDHFDDARGACAHAENAAPSPEM